MRVYLVTCCLNRPFDDQTQLRIRLESAAIHAIITHVETGRLFLVWSDVLDLEVSKTWDLARRSELQRLQRYSTVHMHLDGAVQRRANELQAAGYGAYDALHVACAESAEVDAFLTTDDRLLRKMASSVGTPHIIVANPWDWLQKEVPNEH